MMFKTGIHDPSHGYFYKDHLIEREFQYSNGKSDWNVYADNGKEQGWIEPYQTLEQVKKAIDEKLS